MGTVPLMSDGRPGCRRRAGRRPGAPRLRRGPACVGGARAVLRRPTERAPTRRRGCRPGAAGRARWSCSSSTVSGGSSSRRRRVGAPPWPRRRAARSPRSRPPRRPPPSPRSPRASPPAVHGVGGRLPALGAGDAGARPGRTGAGEVMNVLRWRTGRGDMRRRLRRRTSSPRPLRRSRRCRPSTAVPSSLSTGFTAAHLPGTRLRRDGRSPRAGRRGARLLARGRAFRLRVLRRARQGRPRARSRASTTARSSRRSTGWWRPPRRAAPRGGAGR